MESLMYGGTKLAVHLSLLFSVCIHQSSLLPAYSSFMESVIIRLVKNIYGDLTDVNNYRAITILANMETKLFETLLLTALFWGHVFLLSILILL